MKKILALSLAALVAVGAFGSSAQAKEPQIREGKTALEGNRRHRPGRHRGGRGGGGIWFGFGGVRPAPRYYGNHYYYAPPPPPPVYYVPAQPAPPVYYAPQPHYYGGTVVIR